MRNSEQTRRTVLYDSRLVSVVVGMTVFGLGPLLSATALQRSPVETPSTLRYCLIRLLYRPTRTPKNPQFPPSRSSFVRRFAAHRQRISRIVLLDKQRTHGRDQSLHFGGAKKCSPTLLHNYYVSIRVYNTYIIIRTYGF